MVDITDDSIRLRMVALLGSYGSVTAHGDKFDFHDRPAPSQNIMDAARQKAVEELSYAAVKEECARRIVAVVKDSAAQSNMQRAMMLILAKRQALTTNDQADLKMFHALDAWVYAMRMAWRNPAMLIDDAYLQDSAWPKPPGGIAAFMMRF